MKAEVTVITPIRAKEMLDGNKSNRTISLPHVSMLAKQMKRGDWKMNGEAIKFNGSALLDGQHRLHACIQSNTPFETLVVYGVDKGVFDTLDTGKMRNAGDVISIAGYSDAKNIAAAAYASRWLRTGAGSYTDGRRSMTNAEALLYIQSNPDLLDACKWMQSKRVARRLLTSGIAIALWLEFSKRDAKLANDFFEALDKGVNLVAGDPVTMLREKLVENGMSRYKLQRKDKAAITIKAWNAIVEGTNMKRLVWFTSREEFPAIAA